MKAALAARPDVLLSTSATTRPARAGEREGRDYFFVTMPEFRGMVDRGEMLEWAEVYDDLKGTPRKPVEEAVASDRDVLLEVDIQGAQSIKRAMPEAVLIFIEPPSLEDLALRLRGRGTETAQSMSKRIRSAYEEVRRKGIFDHIVVNDDADRAAADLLRILAGN